ncbi:hypothetical protein [Streptomyces sp. NPDC001816]|uniref:hypothetical protein n=1 Tax=Streptomyces sp. NPDC001816 TaxID=3364612 RepID=UPI0036A983DB
MQRNAARRFPAPASCGVGSGANPDSPELADAIHAYGTVLRELRHAMRHGEPRLETDISN